MQHRMDDVKLDEWEKLRKPIHERPEVSKADSARAEYHCYRIPDGMCYIPADHIRGALIDAGGFLKSKVGIKTKSMKSIVAAMFTVLPEKIIIPDYDEIDKRSAVNRNIKARVITIRPKWTKWEVEFTIQVDEDTISIDQVRQIVEYAGKYVGIGSFRPMHNGRFGRFRLTSIEQLNPEDL